MLNLLWQTLGQTEVPTVADSGHTEDGELTVADSGADRGW